MVTIWLSDSPSAQFNESVNRGAIKLQRMGSPCLKLSRAKICMKFSLGLLIYPVDRHMDGKDARSD